MLKAFGAALLLVSALAMTADPARALQVVVTQVDKNTDGSMTYHFAVKTDPGETLTPGASKATGDFVTVYNFYGLIDGSAKVPAGWVRPKRLAEPRNWVDTRWYCRWTFRIRPT